ncbi:exported hypothetical protein [Nitrospina gracilis 3/211]|uniref:Lipoprotein n=1 Tax=Nitrospina gracilis (strain 3/211) TaxID=1266370 RepID=M1YZ99_NITG3|nr:MULTISPECIES: hypothetical protein [Nitrospina]MCF8723716.1 hypothetical protein [Nitrospina sp. Nb-3]CCQ90814.1 exported hypothetical protein [Nitrospina gracilis 3/211]
MFSVTKRINRVFVLAFILIGIAACGQPGNSGTKSAATAESLKQHVEAAIAGLDPAKLKDFGFAPPYNMADKQFEAQYEVKVIRMKPAGNKGKHTEGEVQLVGSMLDPRTELWLTEMVQLNFVQPDGRGEWKLVLYRGQIEDYLSQVIPDQELRTLSDPLQNYLKSAFDTVSADELESAAP